MAGESAHFGLRERPPTPAIRPFELPPRMRPMLDRAHSGLAEPFRGVAIGGEVVPGLFRLGKTGISTAPVVEAARSFLVALSPEQRSAASFIVGDEAWRKWSNIHPWLMRHGVCLADLGHDQRKAALALMRASLSAAGYQTARDVMRLNQHALEITGKAEEYGEWLYWVSLFGAPSPSEPWGWQIDGHHLNLNCFVLGDQLVLTPSFMGSEPVLARFGKYQGTRVFAAEEERGYALMRSLSDRGTAAGDDRRRSPLGTADGRVQRQPADRCQRDPLWRSAARGPRPARSAARDLYRPHPPGARRNPLGRGETPSRADVFRVDRRVRRCEPVLLSCPEPGDPGRIRSPIGHHV